MCAEAAAMAAAMQKCLASGKSAEQCKAEAMKACLAKGMSKEECTKATEAASAAAEAAQEALEKKLQEAKDKNVDKGVRPLDTTTLPLPHGQFLLLPHVYFTFFMGFRLKSSRPPAACPQLWIV